MHSIRIKRFLLDYLIGSALIFVLLFVLLGNLTVMDTKADLVILEKCTALDTTQDILDSARLALRNDEVCELVQPCNDFQVIHCEGTAKLREVPLQFFAQDLLVWRVQRQLADQYRTGGYADKSTFRVPVNLFIFVLFYLVVLVEAGALLFALWRQKMLRQSFQLSPGIKSNHLFKPLFAGVLLAIVVVGLNSQVNRLFEYPDVENAQAYWAFFQTITGGFFAILVAPFAEELVFRGVLLRLFLERGRQLLGLVLVSVLFAFLHVMSEANLGWQIYKFAVYFFISLVLCWTYIKQKTLWSPILLHGGYNATVIGFLHVFG